LNTTSYIPPINYVNVPSGLQSYWLIPMDGVQLNGTYAVPNVGTPNVAIDTGTTLVGGPPSVVAGLYSMISGGRSAGSPFDGLCFINMGQFCIS
jgi:cathepsin D